MESKKIELYTTTNFCSIYGDILHPDTLKYIKKQDPTYKDMILKEHLYDRDIFDYPIERVKDRVKSELNDIADLMREHACEYIRIIF